MKRAVLAVILLSLLVALPAHAGEVRKTDISFDLTTNSVKETITIDFANATSGEINYTLGAFARDASVRDDAGTVPFILVNENGIEILVMNLERPTTRLTIEYTVNDVIFTSGDVHHFFTELALTTDQLSARVKLPAGYGLFDNSYNPEGADIISDGQRVILLWNSLPGNVFFSVKFVQLNQGTPVIAGLAALLVIAIAAGYFYYKRRVKQEFVSGFRDDEKKVVEYMQQHRYAVQRDIQKMFLFSRAKATRIVHVLEKKGILKKKRFGRTNKLYWVKK